MAHRSANVPSEVAGVRAMKRPSVPGPHVVVRSIAFTPSALEALEDLTSNIALKMAKKSSASAVVRALLRLAVDLPEVTERLAALVEHEQVNEAVSWGKAPKSR
jgi:hypothetical protein